MSMSDVGEVFDRMRAHVKIRRETESTVFVDKYYEMDPQTEDLLHDSGMLEEDMVVLIADSKYRAHINEVSLSSDENVDHARKFNRWATVTYRVVWSDYSVSFVAVYEDGTKRKFHVSQHCAWFVKLNSLPSPRLTDTTDLSDSYTHTLEQMKVSVDSTVRIPEVIVP